MNLIGWYLLLHTILKLTPKVTLIIGGGWPIVYVRT